MAVPSITAGTSGGNDPATTHPAALPAGPGNKFLLRAFRTDPGTLTPPTGWSFLFSGTHAGSGDRLVAWYRMNTSDATADVGSTNSVGSSYAAWSSPDADWPATEVEFDSVTDTGVTTNPDPPAITVPLFDWLFMVWLSHSRNNDVESFPTGFGVEQESGNGAGTSGGGTNTHLAGMAGPASTGVDPDAFGGEQSAEFVVMTAAVPAVGNVELQLATATEHDSASPLQLTVDTGAVTLTLATATEHDSANPLALDAAGAAVLSTAVANERDDANPLTLNVGAAATLTLATTTEHDSAQPLSLEGAGSAELALATSSEHDQAEPLQLGVAGVLTLATTTEHDTANPLALEGGGAVAVALATATEHDTANPLALGVQTQLALATATEHDQASPLAFEAAGEATLTLATAVEWDRAFPLALAVESLADPNAICLEVCDPDTRVTVADVSVATIC